MHTAVMAGAAPRLCLVFFVTVSAIARAGPSDYVFTPIVEQGEREIDFKFGSAKAHDGTRASAASLGLGYGANAWWFTELYAKWNKQTPEGWRFDAIEWENKFQFTETGKYPVDMGLVVELERPQERSEGWELKFGPLFQTDITPDVQANVNLLFERHYRSATPSSLELGYQWQIKYRWRQELELGVQGLGALGPWRDWAPAAQQEHKVGPAMFGKLRTAGRDVVAYNAAWLIGTNGNTPRHTLRLQIEYEF